MRWEEAHRHCAPKQTALRALSHAAQEARASCHSALLRRHWSRVTRIRCAAHGMTVSMGSLSPATSELLSKVNYKKRQLELFPDLSGDATGLRTLQPDARAANIAVAGPSNCRIICGGAARFSQTGHSNRANGPKTESSWSVFFLQQKNRYSAAKVVSCEKYSSVLAINCAFFNQSSAAFIAPKPMPRMPNR